MHNITVIHFILIYRFRAKRKIVLDLRRTKSSENLHIHDPSELTETEDLGSISKTEDAFTLSKKESLHIPIDEAQR